MVAELKIGIREEIDIWSVQIGENPSLQNVLEENRKVLFCEDFMKDK